MVNCDAILASLQKKLLKSQETMKQFTNIHCRYVNFKIGDWILVKLCPHRQTSTTGEPYSELAKHFYGPFQVSQKIGEVAYKLQLPEGSRIHPVFHCSLLKPFHSSSPKLVMELPPKIIENQPLIIPLAILNTRWDYFSGEPKLLVLVQWKGLSPDDTTQEVWDHLKETQHLEDKVFFEVGGDDRVAHHQPHATSTIHHPFDMTTNSKPKRRIIAPKHLTDYI